MAIDYVKMAAVCQRLIDENGRIAIFQQRATATAAVDPMKPWRGNNANAPQSAGGLLKVSASAVFLNYDDKVVVNDLIKRGTKYAYVAQNDFVDVGGNPLDLRQFSQLIDNGEIWEFTDVEVIGPGNLVLMYIVHIKQ